MKIRVERQLIAELLAATPATTNCHGQARLQQAAQRVHSGAAADFGAASKSAASQLLVRMQMACWMAVLHPRLGEDSLAVTCGTDIVCAVAAAVEQNPRTWIRVQGGHRR
jgi:hypothetical protein